MRKMLLIKILKQQTFFIGEILKLVYTGSGALKRSGINGQKIELIFLEIVQIITVGIMFLQT